MGRYHHGDLRQALIAEALQLIQAQGVEGLTLRAIGDRLGVSRTALYRHFADKQALLAAVSREGFRMLRDATAEAWAAHGGGRPGFEAMAGAYVDFAATHPAHYRVMFGRFIERCERDPDLVAEATGAFTVLVEALVAQQKMGIVRADDPMQLARYIWAVVHGTAMLTIDGQLDGDPNGEALTQYAIAQIRTSIARG